MKHNPTLAKDADTNTASNTGKLVRETTFEQQRQQQQREKLSALELQLAVAAAAASASTNSGQSDKEEQIYDSIKPMLINDDKPLDQISDNIRGDYNINNNNNGIGSLSSNAGSSYDRIQTPVAKVSEF